MGRVIVPAWTSAARYFFKFCCSRQVAQMMTPNMNSQPVQSKKVPMTIPSKPLRSDASVLWKAWVKMPEPAPAEGQ